MPATLIDGTAAGEAGRKALLAFAGGLPASGSLLAFDLSKRRIGLAGTDPGRRLVSPLRTLERKGMAADLRSLTSLCRERAVVGLVIGLPLNMDGSEGPAARAMRDRARLYAEGLALPALLQDERLTTETVREAIAEGRLARPKPGTPLDHHAAAVILEDALRALQRATAAG